MTLARFETTQLACLHRGKVRDSFRVDDTTRLVVVSDRLSAFDRVLDTPVPRKGEVLNGIAAHAFATTRDIVPNHLLRAVGPNASLVREAIPIRLEVVVRGYLAGSMARGYSEGVRSFSGAEAPSGLAKHARLPRPLVTPTTKEVKDRPVDPETIVREGWASKALYEKLATLALALFARGTEVAAAVGLLLVDTKYEFGLVDGEVVLIDEAHTPDSSRYWDAADYARDPLHCEAVDKEYVRAWLLAEEARTGRMPNALPPDVLAETARRYEALLLRLTGRGLPAAETGADARLRRALEREGILGSERAYAISPLDGRYRDRLDGAAAHFTEFALMRARVRVEAELLLALEVTDAWKPLDVEERARVTNVAERFVDADFDRIKAHEAVTRHDVKAVEWYLRERLTLREPHRIHFGVTSEDVNNLAWSLMLEGFLREALVPAVTRLAHRLLDLAERYADVPIPTRTHGQRASPSTMGKEFAVFVGRLLEPIAKLRAFRFVGKLNGATGNYSAMAAALPDVDWIAFSEAFVRRLGFEPSLATTQIEDHDRWGEFLGLVRRIANVVLDLDRDVWLYLMLGVLEDRPRPGEIGSSTMPHKVNPIRFENSEGNLELAVPMLGAIADKLSRSRLQRDLSDSTVTRNLGVPLAHVLLALFETTAGLERVEVHIGRCREELAASPELLAEPIQSILRVSGFAGDPYEEARLRTRGRPVTRDDLVAWVQGLDVPDEAKARVQALDPVTYVGLAPAVCRRVVAEARRVLAEPA